jgi:hypothetical protein
MGGERGKGGKSYWGGNGIIEMERQLSEITETELKFPSQLIILFLAPLLAKKVSSLFLDPVRFSILLSG